jgi:putative salt-induced outer membrane protein
MLKVIVSFALGALVCAPALAQTATKEWTGEGAFNAGVTQGNTKTTDVGGGLKLKHTGAAWSQSAELAADYGKTNGVETKNRLFGALQLDRNLDERLSLYGRVSAEHDEFSGFDNRYFVGLGLGYQAVKTDKVEWRLEGGPGYKIDELANGSSEESFGAQAASRYKVSLNDKVAITNDTDVLYSEASTQYRNVIALTADIMGNLQARLSYDIRYETDPPAGFKSTDTTTKVSLVYKIG